ncbi:hypothetical protein KCV04_g5, partial [Aureobasidium melanogenum]
LSWSYPFSILWWMCVVLVRVTLTHFIAFVIRVHHTVLHTVLFDQNNKELCSKPLFEVIKERGRVIKGYSTVRVGNTVPPSLVRDENSSIAPPAM